MLVIAIIQHTPVWVWILFIYLLSRGIKALKTREVPVGKLFLIPVLFLLWAIHGVFTETHWTLAALGVMLAGLLSGCLLGAMLGRRNRPTTQSSQPGTIIRPGSVLPLIFMVVAFIAKYVLSVSVILQPALIDSLTFNLAHGLISGLTAGVFWGNMLVAFIPWYRSRIKPA
ncbi:DUF6622 family protein [Pantoea phytobeneficialis]|uniref:DUF1453 domain-containing protein n=1 Tax=Pantoea phytobeneficialis TaxID=2052056 RepID=A0AAP9H5B6_9GAMM|nr:DUF6622 family protein [Pantoea phytobeneficialis]MDO6405698.1 hypothetical protein [Pantoea phytobeneficialis]QGR06662.1 hypothetical protein CTZ24_09670 [Pantoea phytobeneficialis]